jgi:hypothetical protein
MNSLRSRSSKKPQGVIVWDFDGVLFEIDRYRLSHRSAWITHGVPRRVILSILDDIRRKKELFSTQAFYRGLRKHRYTFSLHFVRSVFHNHLRENHYYSIETDRMLDRFHKKWFILFVLSKGSAPYQYKKMDIGCGKSFRNHFEKLIVTPRAKYYTLLRLRRKYQSVPFVFVDDTKENLLLAKKHVPSIKTMYYSNSSDPSVRHLEKAILQYAKNKK